MTADPPVLVCLACARRHIRSTDDYLTKFTSCRDLQPAPYRMPEPSELGIQLAVVGGALGFATLGLSVLEHLRF